MICFSRREALAFIASAPLALAHRKASAGGTPKTFTLHASPRPIPDIVFAHEDGRPGALADFRGRHVLLNIWATWCAPCREEMPALDRLQGAIGGAGFHVLPVSIDRAGVSIIQKFYAKTGIKNLAIYTDRQAAIMRTMKVGGLPATFLIEPGGRQIGALAGPAEWDAPELVALFRDRISA